MSIRTCWLVPVVLAGLMLAPPVGAQSPATATIAGTLRDLEGQPMAAATLVIRTAGTELRRETQTDNEGRFSMAGFRPGRYHLLVLREGEIVFSLPFTLPENQARLQLDLDLERLQELARQRTKLDPDLERRRHADQEQQEREQTLNAHYNRGARFLRENDATAAIEEYQAALALEPNRSSTYAMLGAAHAAAGETERAIEAYQRAIELEPDEAAHHNNLGTLLVGIGRSGDGLAHIERAATLDSTRAASFHFNRGAVLLNSGRAEEALGFFQQAARHDPTLAVAHYFLGVALFRTSPPLEEPEAAPAERVRRPMVEAFQRYLQLEPEGAYAAQAREYLERLGAPATDMLLPRVPMPQDMD